MYPEYTLRRIERAISERDVLTLERLIDWPQLRTGIKADFVGPALAQKATEGGMGALGAALGASLVNNMVDNMVNAALLVQRASDSATRVALFERYEGGRFISVGYFVADFRAPDAPPFSFLLELQGTTWRVTRVVPSPEMRDVLVKTATSSDADVLMNLRRPK